MKRVNQFLATLVLVTAPAAALTLTPRTAAACWGCIEGTCASGIGGYGAAIDCLQEAPGRCRLIGVCIG
jgi:hypothetical protein